MPVPVPVVKKKHKREKGKRRRRVLWGCSLFAIAAESEKPATQTQSEKELEVRGNSKERRPGKLKHGADFVREGDNETEDKEDTSPESMKGKKQKTPPACIRQNMLLKKKRENIYRSAITCY